MCHAERRPADRRSRKNSSRLSGPAAWPTRRCLQLAIAATLHTAENECFHRSCDWHPACARSEQETSSGERSNGLRYLYFGYRGVLLHRLGLCPGLGSYPVSGGAMGLESILGFIVSLAVLGYLLYALLWPEKF